MHKLLEKLDKELHKYANKEGELTPQEWSVVFDAIEARKDLLTSMAMEGEDEYGNYEGERSSGYNSYSRRGRRYSGHDGQQKMLENLRSAMALAESEEERRMIQKCIDKLEY